MQTHQVTDLVVRHLTSTVTPQPLVGVSPFVDVDLGDALGRAYASDVGGCVALLHEVRDPGNAGTVLRSCDASGTGAVVFSTTSVDIYNPKTVRASAGSVFHLPVVRAVETLEALEHARALGARVLVAPNGLDALQVLQSRRPDAILLDLMMPVMDGFTFARRLSRDRPDRLRALRTPLPPACRSAAYRSACKPCPAAV